MPYNAQQTKPLIIGAAAAASDAERGDDDDYDRKNARWKTSLSNQVNYNMYALLVVIVLGIASVIFLGIERSLSLNADADAAARRCSSSACDADSAM